MLFEKLTEAIEILEENYNIDDPLFLKQVLLLEYYISNASETLSSEVKTKFDNLKEKCYNDIVKEDSQEGSKSAQKPSAPERQKVYRAEQLGLIDKYHLSLLTTTTFFPMFRGDPQLSSSPRKR